MTDEQENEFMEMFHEIAEHICYGNITLNKLIEGLDGNEELAEKIYDIVK